MEHEKKRHQMIRSERIISSDLQPEQQKAAYQLTESTKKNTHTHILQKCVINHGVF